MNARSIPCDTPSCDERLMVADWPLLHQAAQEQGWLLTRGSRLGLKQYCPTHAPMVGARSWEIALLSTTEDD